MSSTFQPPIHLDPTQDPAQQTAFINQNFQSLASALETNSFRIVKSGSISSTGFTIGAPGAGKFVNGGAQTTVAHGLSFIPIIIGYVTGGGTYAQMPYIFSTGNGATEAVWSAVTLATDATNIYMNVNLTIAGVNGATLPAGFYTTQYYLLQQAAN